jgi:preprotein translocase SecE subunit
MAVAEKKSQEARTSSLFDRVPVISLVGVVYLLACLAIIFKFLPDLCRLLWGKLGLNANSFTANSILLLLMLGAGTGLVVLGAKLLGPKQQPGVRAGVFWGLIYLLGVVLMTRWVSMWIEKWVYYDRWFGEQGRTVGIVLTILAGAGFTFLALRWFMRPGFERMLVRFESAGWFRAQSYKPQQGQKVRRGTILGILLLLGAGIWTLWNHKILERGSENWEIGIPFTGTVRDIDPGDAEPALGKEYPNWRANGVPAYEFRKIIDQYDPTKKLRIDTPTNIFVTDEQGVQHTFKDGEVLERSKITELKKNLSDSERARLPDADEARKLNEKPVVVPVATPMGRMELANLVLLPHIRYTLPLLVLPALALWFAWRVVNVPVFADFLIATEAELNKVSWTTRRRLFQDTVVVLTTMVLLAALLFAMDQMWLHLLSWKRIGVIYQDDTPAKTTKDKVRY